MVAYSALSVVVLAGIFLSLLAVASLFAPEFARRFLLGFARTAQRHYWELAARLLVGCAFVVSAPYMVASTLFTVFGWVLVVSTIAMGAMPWRLHRRFAEHMVPHAVRHIGFIGLVSLACGLGIIASVLHGGPT